MRLQTIFDLLALASAQSPRSIGNAVSSYMLALNGPRSNPADYNRVAVDSSGLAGLAFQMNKATWVNGQIVSDEMFTEAVEAFQRQIASVRRQASEQWGITGGRGDSRGW